MGDLIATLGFLVIVGAAVAIGLVTYITIKLLGKFFRWLNR
jgi:hypothetical protein